MKKVAVESKLKYWQDIILRWQDSGLSKSAFCRQESLRLNTFLLWNLKLGGDRLRRIVDDSTLVPTLLNE
jgi:hypothetical protein